MSKRLLLILTIFPIFLALRRADDWPQQQPDETNTVANIKANFIYQFANSSDWPSQMKKGKFVIAVLGNQDIYEELATKYGLKHVGSQVLQIVNLATFKDNQTIHILYVDKSRKLELPQIVKDLKGSNTLIVTHFEGALAQGAAINFKPVNSNIRYELNRSAAEDKKISLGTKILQWAVN